MVKLQLPANDTMRYHAGQYVEFILRDGARRSYSMANAPHTWHASYGRRPAIELHIRHMPGGKFTDHVFTAMKEKEILRVEGPYGSFYLREDSDKPMVLLASGTGFAPIKAVIEHMQFKGITRPADACTGAAAGRPICTWTTGCRQQLAEMPNLKYVPVISNALPEDNWTGRTGFVHKAVLEDFPDLSGHQVYACGAPIVVDSARAGIQRAAPACRRRSSTPTHSRPKPTSTRTEHTDDMKRRPFLLSALAAAALARRRWRSRRRGRSA